MTDINKPSLPRLQAAYCIVLLSLAVSGCQTASLPAPMTVEQAVAWQDSDAERYAVDDEWWQQYHDAQLNQLIQDALTNNIDLQQAALTAEQALYQARAQGAKLQPSAAGSLSASSSKNLNTGDVSSRSFGANLGLSYEVDLWGQLRDAADAKAWTYHASAQNIATAKLTLIHATIDTYFQLVYLQAAIEQGQSNIATYQELWRIADTKYRYGKVDVSEPTQAKQALASAQASLIVLQSQRQSGEQTLRQLLNLPPSAALALVLPKMSTLQPLGVNTDVPLSVLAHRPDLRATEYTLRSSFKNWAAMKKSFYPTVSLGASLSSSSRQLNQAFKLPVLGGSVGISLPFLNWNELKWNIKTSQSQYQSQLLAFEQAINTALNEVDGLYFAYRQALATEQTLTTQWTAAAKLKQYYASRHQYGAAEFKDYLNAQTSADGAYLAWLNGRYARLQAENKVYQAMAGRYRPQP